MSHPWITIAAQGKPRKKWTPSDHLVWIKWLLEFHSVDLSSLTKEQKRGLSENIVKFSFEYPFGVPIKIDNADRKSPSSVQYQLNTLQKQLRSGMDSLLVGEKPNLDLNDIGAFLPVDLKDSAKVEVLFPQLWVVPIKSAYLSLWRFPEYKLSRGGKPRPYRSGGVEFFLNTGWPDIFWVAVADLLRLCGDRVRQCQKKECGKLFVKTKQQDYCSLPCSQSTRSRKWYEKNQWKAKQERQHRYRKQMQSQFGDNVKIGYRKTP